MALIAAIWTRTSGDQPSSTSCVGGVSPSAPCDVLRRGKDVATALALAQAKIAPHHIHHDCSARLRMRAVSCLARAFANWLKKDVVSVDMRPPTSTSRTTRRALVRGPTSSGYVRSFLWRALCKTTPSMFSAPLCGDPSQWRALTTVASTATWNPPNRGRPPTTTSSLRPSPRSKSRTTTLVVTLHFPTRTHLLVHTMLGCGQTCRLGGHTGKCGAKEAVGTGDVAAAQRGTNRNQRGFTLSEPQTTGR